jgi:hypothetical protein
MGKKFVTCRAARQPQSERDMFALSGQFWPVHRYLF